MLHRIFQRHHIAPDEFRAKDWRFQAFMFASEELVIEEEIEAERKRKASKK